MSSNTSNRAYTFPTSNDDVRPYEDIQALAEDVDADVNTIVNKPIGRITVTGTQALADNTQVAIQFPTDDIDTHNQHDPAVNNTRVTPNVAGYYRFDGAIFFNEQTTPASIDANFRKNGVTNLPSGGRMPGSATIASAIFLTLVVAMNGSSDYIEAMGRQDSAGADTTHQSAQFSSFMQWEYLRPL